MFTSEIESKFVENKNEFLKTPILLTLKSMDLLYKEIDGYNRQFWSKYLLSFGIQAVFLLYITAFVPMNLILKMISFFIFIGTMTFFLFVILNASSVNFESKKSYKILNSLYVSYYSSQWIRIRSQLSIVNIRVFDTTTKYSFNELLHIINLFSQLI